MLNLKLKNVTKPLLQLHTYFEGVCLCIYGYFICICVCILLN